MDNFVSIVNVGTEIVDGDVVNSNAAWLAQQLTQLGFHVRQHISVPDDTESMLKAFTSAAAESDLLFVTGGLGPTSDDFTRDVIAQYLARAMEFNEASWQRVQTLLKTRNVSVSELNRRQCFFPGGAEIFQNLAGTADAFRMFENGKEWVVLPGPPKELQFIWHQHLKPIYQFKIPENRRTHLEILTTYGESESRLGEVVEEIFRGTEFQIGYRARIPFVDLKFWYRHAQKNLLDEKLNVLRKTIEPFIVSSGVDILDEVLTQFYFLPQVQIIDAATLGLLTERLFKKLVLESYVELRTKTTAITVSQTITGSAEQSCIHILKSAQEHFVITVTGIDDKNSWCLGVKMGLNIQTHVEKLRFSGKEFADRNRKTIVELAFIHLNKILNQSSQSQKGH